MNVFTAKSEDIKHEAHLYADSQNMVASLTTKNQLKACRGQIDKSEVKLVRRYNYSLLA